MTHELEVTYSLQRNESMNVLIILCLEIRQQKEFNFNVNFPFGWVVSIDETVHTIKSTDKINLDASKKNSIIQLHGLDIAWCNFQLQNIAFNFLGLFIVLNYFENTQQV